ncbi:MAG: tetratricopeptide repeat protein [Acidobacteria bacterium]|nr:tetratricopeptide repeat protein [Acidobacteriota bacterium]
MKAILYPVNRGFAAAMLTLMMVAATVASPAFSPQDKDKKAPQISADEQKALLKIKDAPDPAAKLQAASEYIKKYPKSPHRFEAASHVSGEITKAEPATQITLAQTYLTIFTDAKEADLINAVLVDAYLKTNKIEEGFKLGAAYVEKNPDEVGVLTQLAVTGVEQAKQRNTAYVQQSVNYGMKAIALIEADKIPETYNADARAKYKTFWLPYLYQSLGLVAYMSGNKEDARAKLDKALAINPNDPFTYVLLGSLINEEYQTLAESHKTMMSGPLKDETLKRATAKIDEIVDLYAHAIALAAGDAKYQTLHDQIMQDLTTYYKYRHNGTTEGLQALIDKYKKL